MRFVAGNVGWQWDDERRGYVFEGEVEMRWDDANEENKARKCEERRTANQKNNNVM